MGVTLNGAVPESIFTGAIVGGKNAVINGGMDIWQRGTSIAIAASSGFASNYTADRWQISNTGTGQALTISRQATGDTTNLPNIQYGFRFQRNSGQTGTGGLSFAQSIETVNSIPLAGKTVTVSFYARAGANYSATSNALPVYLYGSTGTDQNIFSTWAGSSTVANQTNTLTTTWQRFTMTGTVGATVTQLAVLFQYTPTGTAGANDYLEITGVQLELGSVATTFSRAGGSIGGEDILCQRYLPRLMLQSDSELGYAFSTTQCQINLKTKVTTRAPITGILLSSAAHFNIINQGFGSGACTAIAFNSGGTNECQVNTTTVAATPTLAANQFTTLQGINAGAFILGTGCEL